MSITVEISGVELDPERRRKALEFAERYARDMEWTFDLLAETPTHAFLHDAVFERPKLSGINLLPHFASDPIPIFFLEETGTLIDSYLQAESEHEFRLQSSAIFKTHFAGAETHREVCEFLSQMQNYLPGLRVDDASGYFEQRDATKLKLAFEESWAALVSEIKSQAQLNPGQVWSLGGFTLRVPAPNESAISEFEKFADDTIQALDEAASDFNVRFGGSVYNFNMSRESVNELDLLMSEADDSGFGERLDDPEVQEFVLNTSIYFGRTLARTLGGYWEQDESGIFISNVGGVGLRVDPFLVTTERVRCGPPFDPTRHFETFEKLILELRRLLPEASS